MIRNMGRIDRTIRIILSAVLVYLVFIDTTLITNQALRIILSIIALINIGSAVTGLCPMYIFANISTNHENSAKSDEIKSRNADGH